MLASGSIRRLLAWLVLALLAPSLGLTAYFGYQSFISERTRVERELRGLADAASTGVRQFLTDSESLLRGLAADPHIQAMDPAECASHMQELEHTVTPTYVNVGTWRLDGTPVCGLLPTPESGLDMGGVPGFAEALASDSLHITPVQRGQRSGRWSTVLTFPIRDDGGSRVGMASLSVDLVRFEEILVRMEIPEAALISMTELGGTVVARSRDSERWVGRSPPAADASSRDDPSFETRGTSRARTFDGVDFSWGFQRVPNTNWVVYAGTPTEVIMGPVRSRTLQLTLLGTLVVLLAVLVAWVVYSRITTPLQALVGGIASADPATPSPLPTDGPEEIAWVAGRFNQAWSARHEAERERERSDERIRSIVEHAVTGICITTRGGQFLEANQAMVDLLGFDSLEELRETHADEVYFTPEDRARHLSAHAHLETFRSVPVQWRRRDGAALDVRISGRRMVLDDGEVAWEIIVEDVTELTRLQAQYAQAQKMEALGRLAGGIAHDFNNLLTVVQGQADLLREDPDLDADVREQAEEIYQASTRGAALNEQLLAFGRRGPSHRQPADLNQIIDGFDLVIRRAAGEDVRLSMELQGALGTVLADQSQVEQILMNLVVNAKDAMPAGGTLHVRTYEEDVSEEEAAMHTGARVGPHVVLSVTDSGAGISDDVLPHIFEPFFSTKPVAKGTGLGLATVYGIVTDSGGHLRVRSTEGSGTTILAYFPRHDQPTPTAASDKPPRTSHEGTGVILLVEDEAAVRRLTQRVLERAGYQVIAAEDGHEAITLAEAHEGPIDLLVTDVVMPGPRGHQVAETLAASGRIQRAVFVSGYPEGLPEAGPKGVDAWTFLAKPFASAALLSAVERLMPTH